MEGKTIQSLRVIPIRIKQRDDAAGCDVLRGVGFRAISSDGWQGPTRKVRQDAVADMIEYRAANPPIEAKA